MNSKQKILWISWHPNPYNNYLFEEVNKHYDLEVVFIKGILSSHPWDSEQKFNFKSHYFDKNPFQCLLLLFKKYNLKIVAGWDHYLMILALGLFALGGSKYAIWTDTPKKERKRPILKQLYHHYYLGMVIKRAYSILVTGNVGVQYFKDIYGKNLNVINFPFATNIDFYKPLPVNEKKENNTLSFLSVGRLVNWHKGYDIAIKAFHIIKNKYPSVSIQYTILGEGADRANLEGLIKEYGLENWIQLPGWSSPDNILKAMQTSHVFIHSSHFDPFPNVVLEAMAVGLPVIGSNGAGSVVDRIKNKVNGLIFTDNDEQMLAKHINYILNNMPTLSSMSVAARATAESYEVSYNLKQLEKLTT